MPDQTHSIGERFARLEDAVRQHGEDLAGQGVTIDHLTNTMDTIVIPTLGKHTDTLDQHAVVTRKASEFMAQASGAWLFIQRAGIVIAAIASVVTLAMKLWSSKT